MSGKTRSGRFANSGIVAQVPTSDFPGTDPLSGVEYQRHWERAAFEAVNGAPEPTTGRTLEHGVGYTWTMDLVDRLPRPLVADPTAEAPHVVWSTWQDWHALGSALAASLDGAVVLSDALRDSVAELIEDEPDAWSKAVAVAAFVFSLLLPAATNE